jgi:hypothetical protein
VSPVVQLPGTYILLATNPTNGCVARDTVVMAADVNQPLVGIATPALLTCTTTTVALNGTATGVNAGLVPLWNTTNGQLGGNSSSLQATAQGPGTYTLLVTDPSNGCTAQMAVTVQQNIQPPIAEAGNAATLTCATTSITLAGGSSLGAAADYAWNTIDGFIVSGQNSTAPLVNEAGTYALVVTDPQNGCTATDNVVIGQNTTPPTVQIATPTMLTCTQTSVGLVATTLPAMVNAVWATSNGHFTNGQSTLTPSVDQPGTYNLTISNPINGCSNVAQVFVNQNIAPPNVDAGASATLKCNLAQIQLEGAAIGMNGTPVSVVWSTVGGNILLGGNTLQPQINQSGIYVLTATDPANGCTRTDQVVITTDSVAPILSIATPELLTCTRQQVVLLANAAQTGPNPVLLWSTQLGHFANGQNTLLPTVDVPAEYNLLVTNPSNGCTAQVSVTVGQDVQLPIADAGQSGVLHCNLTELSLVGSAMQAGNMPQYLWSTTNGQFSGNTQTPTVVASAAGTYLLRVTNPANGCTDTDEVVISSLLPPSFAPISQQPTCLQPLGMLGFGNVLGGTPPFVYSFDGGNTFAGAIEKSNLPHGAYHLVLEDANGCHAETELTLAEPLFPSVTLPSVYEIELGDSVRLIPQLAFGAPNNYVWAWQEGAATTTLSCPDCPKPWATPFTNATYVLTITDSEGCTATAQTAVKVDTRRYIYAPNVIAPDGDAPNNRFTIFGRGIVQIDVLEVYDRWGALLWQGRQLSPGDLNTGWDGTRNDRRLDPGVFVWKAVLVFPGGKRELYAGDVTVVR